MYTIRQEAVKKERQRIQLPTNVISTCLFLCIISCIENAGRFSKDKMARSRDRGRALDCNSDSISAFLLHPARPNAGGRIRLAKLYAAQPRRCYQPPRAAKRRQPSNMTSRPVRNKRLHRRFCPVFSLLWGNFPRQGFSAVHSRHFAVPHHWTWGRLTGATHDGMGCGRELVVADPRLRSLLWSAWAPGRVGIHV